jgi:hypothetical protein
MKGRVFRGKSAGPARYAVRGIQPGGICAKKPNVVRSCH